MELDRGLFYSRGWGRHMRSWPRRLLGVENLKENMDIYKGNRFSNVNNLQYYTIQALLEVYTLNIEIKNNFVNNLSNRSYLEKILDKYY